MQLSLLINKVNNFSQFSEKKSLKMGLKLSILIYKSIFAQKYYQNFIIHWLDAWEAENN